MIRYLKATLVVATISFLIVALLYSLGLTRTPDQSLLGFLRLPAETKVGPTGYQYILMVIFALALAWTTIDIPRPALKTTVVTLTIILLLTGAWTFSLYGVLFSPFPTIGVCLLSYAGGLVYGRTSGGARKRVFQRLFEGRLENKRFLRLVDSSLPTHLPGEIQNATVLVCEVFNHDKLIGSMEPADYVAMMNLYLDQASDYLVLAGGYLDECDGGRVRVVFGSPLPEEKHAEAACRAALELMARLDSLNKECDSRWHKRLDFRIGITSGEVVGGAFGGRRLGAFSVVGNPVEFAHRLCSAAHIYGARILLSGETFEQVSSLFETRPMELVRNEVTGRRQEIHELLSVRHGLSPERTRSRDHFWKGVIYYREKEWDKAVEEFSKARIPGLPDEALDFYVQRVERARRGAEDRSSRTDRPLEKVL